MWIWATGVAMMLAVVWLTMGTRPVKPTDEGEKCLAAAKHLLTVERAITIKNNAARIYGGRAFKKDYDAFIKDKKNTLQGSWRAYAKAAKRLKESESVFHRESSAIEKWMVAGRETLGRTPRTEKEFDTKAEQLDKDWEIFMEQDLVDLLKSDS